MLEYVGCGATSGWRADVLLDIKTRIHPNTKETATPFAPDNFHVSIAKHFFRFGSRVPGHVPNFRRQQSIIELHGTLLRHARFAGKNFIVVRGGRRI